MARISSDLQPVTDIYAELKAAWIVMRHATMQSHNGHWDPTMRSGAGCPECIRSRKERQKADEMFLAAMTKLRTMVHVGDNPKDIWELLNEEDFDGTHGETS